MKLIIDIPDNDYRQIKEYYEKNDIAEATYSYIYHGIPFDESFINKPCISEGVCHEDKIKVLNKIRNDVKQLLNANPSYWNKCDVVNRYEVLAIIDKYTKGDTNE